MATRPNNPTGLGARDALAAIRAGRLDPRELAEACLARIEEREEAVRAWAFLDPELARSSSRAVDPAGALAGLPVGVKDIIDTGDMPTASGSKIHEGRRPTADASAVAALRAAGGIVLGKTRTTEFAAYAPTLTRNPRDLRHTPGGSSSGSAAAVADFQVPLALGTQTAGSIIRPASFCGVVGLKPSFGLIDLRGVQPFAASLDTLGVFARDVGDAGLLAGVLAGWDALAEARSAPPARVRLVRAPRWELASPETDAALERAARAFAEAGIPVDETPLGPAFEAVVAAQETIQSVEGLRALAWERLTHPGKLSDDLRTRLDEAAEIPFETYRAARIAQIEWQRRIDDMLGEGEVWLTASAPGEAPEGIAATGDPIFCRPWTFLGLPAITLPNGSGARGLPLGTQLVGRRWEDPALVAAAEWLEKRLA